jgi:hypothetical protein
MTWKWNARISFVNELDVRFDPGREIRERLCVRIDSLRLPRVHC